MCRFFSPAILFPLSLLAASGTNATPDSPYGVCAHLASGEEHAAIPQNLRLMQAAGIDWARADFAWSGVVSRDGKWQFAHLDRVLENATKEHLTILPILDYNVPWAMPAYRHLDAWGEYVQQVVSRYRHQIKYWEVWNEQNLEHFWSEKPDPKAYQLLLQCTYETVKKIDPQLQVVYGGLAGIPKEFIEQSLDAGAVNYFDVFNIHPYRAGMTTMRSLQRYYDELVDLRKTLNAHGAKEKPIWITELGWATPPGNFHNVRGVLAATKAVVAPEAKNWTLAVLLDERFAPMSWGKGAVEKLLPPGFKPRYVTLDDLALLDPQQCDALLLPPGEFCPTPYFDALQAYVKKGGTLFLIGGVPLYYDMAMKDGYLVESSHAPDKWRTALRIGWSAWWTQKGVPETASISVAGAAVVKNAFADFPVGGEAGRFLDGTKLLPGDEFIPLLEARTNDFSGVAAAVYKFKNGMSGAVAVCTMMGDLNTTETEQALYLPQAILLSLQGGVSRYFWYEFHAPERDANDREHHFGIVHDDLKPKPAYHAYATLTRARPAGSVNLTKGNAWNKDDRFCEIRWRRPDGKTGTAYWAPTHNISVALAAGAVAFDHLGNPVEIKNSKLALVPSVIYVVEPSAAQSN